MYYIFGESSISNQKILKSTIFLVDSQLLIAFAMLEDNTLITSG